MTQRGVILVDVPEPLPFRPPLRVVPEIAEITDKPITHLIYSHAHFDHIGGAGTVVKAFPDVKIIAHKRTRKSWVRANDSRRPVPHQAFEENLHLDVGGKRLELSYHGNIHQEGNIWVYAPNERILMGRRRDLPRLGAVPATRGVGGYRRLDTGAGRRADVRFRRLDRRPQHPPR